MTTRTGGHPLAPIATDSGVLAIIAMDQRNTLKRMYAAVGIENPDTASLIDGKTDILAALRGTASAFLLDPTYGTPALAQLRARDGAVPAGDASDTASRHEPAMGVLVAAEPVERGNYQGEPRVHRDPTLDAAWVRGQGGDAMKFLVQLRVDRPVTAGGPDLAAEGLAVVAEVVADCRAAGVPSVIENLIYALPGEGPATASEKADRIIAAAQALNDLRPDLLKLEYPGSPAACRRLAEVIDVPWAVLSAGVAFEEFADVLTIACDEGGASGFIAGRAIWKDTIGMSAPDRRAFLADEGRRRLEYCLTAVEGRAKPLG